MRIILLIITTVLLTACAQQKPSQLDQGQQCWINAKSQFVAANPHSPAAWYLPDNYTPTPKDLRSKAKVTPLEKEHLAYLIKTYQNCYDPPLQLTGDAKYDDYLRRDYKSKVVTGDAKQDALMRTTYLSNFVSLIDIIQYMHGDITRGEYYKRYKVVKARFDADTKQELAAIRAQKKAQEAAENTYPTSPRQW